MQYEQQVNPNLKGLALAMAVFGLLLLYAIPALSSRNPTWFLPSPAAEPNQIVTYHNGMRTVYLPGSPGFRLLAPLCQQALGEVSGLLDAGLSEATLRELRSSGNAVEVYFSRPITIPNAAFSLGHPNQVIVPLDDKYDGWQALFTGNDGRYWAQGLRIPTTYWQIKAAHAELPVTSQKPG